MKILNQQESSYCNKNYFTIIELLLVIAIIAILVSMLVPSLHKARSQTLKAACASNMSQLNKAYMMYSTENKQFLVSPETSNHNGHPPAWILRSRWNFDTNVEQSPLWPYIGSKEVYRCSNESRDSRFGNGNYKRSFSLNVYLGGRGWVSNKIKNFMLNESPSSTINFLDEEDPRGNNIGSFVPARNTSKWVDWPANNHGDKSIPLSFMDGHVSSYFFKDNATSQISWFFSSSGYEDRVNIINLSTPLD